MIRIIIGLLLAFGAVGGMDDPAQAGDLAYQIAAAALGLLLMFWGIKSLDKASSL